MKKKHLTYAKKTLSVFLTVLMLMSAWVFFPGMVTFEAEARATINDFRVEDKYGTPYWDGKDTYYSTWNSGSSYTKFTWPKHIYLDKDETLQTAGYYYTVEWDYGNGTDYRIVNNGFIFGGWRMQNPSQWPASYNIMNELFISYDLEASTHGTQDGIDGESSTAFDLKIGSDNWDGAEVIIWRNPSNDNNAQHQYVFMMGTPARTGKGRYTTSGAKPNSFGGWQYWSNGWKNASDKYTNSNDSSNWTTNCYEGTWKEVAFDITIYDKTALGTAVATAKNMLSETDKYSRSYLAKLRTACDAAEAVLTTRAIEQDAIDKAKNDLQTVINAAEMRNYDVTFENMFSITDWYYSDCFGVNSTSAEVTVTAEGSVRIWKNIVSEAFTSYSSGNHGANMYSIPVEGGKQYTISFNNRYSASGGNTKSQVYFFWFDVNGEPVTSTTSANTYDYADFTGNGVRTATFTAPSNAKSVEIRFDNDCNTGGSTVYFENITVYPADRGTTYDIENWTTRPYTRVYTYNASLGTSLTVPTRKGYDFNGWYLDNNTNGVKDDGEEVTDANGTVVTNLQSFPITAHYNLYADWTPRTLDVGYDNLFSLSDWAKTSSSASSNASRGEVKYDLDNGTITVNTANTGEVYTNYGSASSHYQMAVEPGTEYIFKADMNLDAGTKGQMFVFFYKADGSGVAGAIYNGTEQTNTHIGIHPTTNGTQSITFTTPADCTKMAIRVGATDVGTTATYSNIGFYKKAAYDDYAKNYAKVREPFKVTDNSKTLLGPTRDGYVFDGWEKEDGTKITNTAGLDESITVYANWTKLWTVTFLNADGTVYTTVQVKNGENVTLPATSPSKDPDATASYAFAGWEGNLTNVTEDRTVTPTFTATAHNFVWAVNYQKQPTCTEPALVHKYCENCNYSLGNVSYNGDKENWLARGHDYSDGGILAGSSTGNTDADTHSLKCVRYDTCGSVEKVAHQWDGNESQGATCTTPGTIKKTCPCGAEKYVDGETDTTAHNYDLTQGTSNNDGKTHTVACTYNPDHTKSVDCTDDNSDCKCNICGQELIHVYDKKTKTFVKSEADCYNDAVYYYTCQCGKQGTETWTDEGSMLKHNWTDTETNLKSEADCENDAVYYKECSLCHASSEDITGDTWTKADTKTGHEYTGTVRDNKNGTHSYLCANGCNTYGYNGVKEASTACTYGAWSNTETDTHTKTCTECSYSVTEDHDWTAWTSTDEDKAAAGQHTRSCKDCGRVETVDCTYTDVETKNTCTEDGYTTHTCNDCGHEYVTAGATKTGHDYTGKVQNLGNGTHNYLCKNGCNTYGYDTVKDATTACTYKYENIEAGKHQVTCTECNYTFAQGCSGGTATCTAPATCEKCKTAYGTTAPHSFKGEAVKLDGDFHAYLCEFCGKTTGIKGVGDSIDGKEACSGGKATCSALAVCEKCGDGHGELDADAHKWGEWRNVVGTETHIRVCEYNTAHEESGDCYSPDVTVISPDCETAGYTVNVCEFCNHEWHTNPTEPLDHDWSAWGNNGDGTHTRVCKDTTCKYGEDGGAKAETADCTKENADAVVTKPTCTKDGYTTYTCKDCGYVWTDDATDATGHSYAKQTKKTDAKYQRTAKDCVTDWTYWYCCDECDVSAETEKDKYDDITALYWVRETAVGHKFDAKKAEKAYLASEATCTAKATYYYSCSVCGTSSKDSEGEKTFEYGAVLGHDWQNTVTFKKSDADCINNEVYYKECSRCHISSEGVTDETWEKVDTKAGHDFDYEGGYTAGVAANCTDAGVVEHYTCQTCGKHYTDEAATKEIAADKLVIAALKHDYKDIAKKDATCEEDGYTAHKQCQRAECGYRNNDYKVIPATGHDFKAENGYYYDTIYNYHAYKCSDCECYGVDSVKYSVDASGLDPVIEGGIACTFTGEYVNYEDENGVHSHKLTCECGNVQGAVCVDKDGPVYTDPVCEKDGFDTYECTVCGYEWTVADEGTALEHDLKTKSNGNGTHSVVCETGCGYAEAAEKCSTETPATVCGTYDICDVCKTAFGEAKPHVFTDYVSDENATCTADGTKTAVCDTCIGEEKAKDTVTDKGSKRGHNMTEYGYDISGWKNKPADFSEVIVESTCCTEGRSISYCTRCDKYDTKTIKADPDKHQWAKDEASEDGLLWVPVSGDCSTGITVTNSCTVEGCGKVQTKVIYDVEHTYEVTYEELPTCEDEGVRIKECVLCGERFDEHYNQETGEPADLAPTGKHTYEEISATPATCTKNAYVTKQCKVCTEIIIEETEGTMLEHAYIEYDEAAPTCEADGHSAYFKCSDCGAEKDKTVIEATGHSDTNGDGKCDDCFRLLYGDGEKSCGCICHKDSFLMRIIYKILQFFWKLFKISKSCNCGEVHW